jgi:hypothetical protein
VGSNPEVGDLRNDAYYLETFDVCVFELFSEDNIKVHIYRASIYLTAYLPDSSSK